MISFLTDVWESNIVDKMLIGFGAIYVAAVATLLVAGLLCMYRFQCTYDGELMVIYGCIMGGVSLTIGLIAILLIYRRQTNCGCQSV